MIDRSSGVIKRALKIATVLLIEEELDEIKGSLDISISRISKGILGCLFSSNLRFASTAV